MAAAAPPDLFTGNGRAPVPLQETPPGARGQSARACAGCHVEIWEEWKESLHSAAWNDPHFQELWREQNKPSACLNCHSPLTAQQPRLGGESNPGFDPTLQAEGVTCAACHVRGGKIVGRGTSTGETPHPIRKVEDFGSKTVCGACHQLALPGSRRKGLYDTLREWEAAKGRPCQDCHMPMRQGNVAVGVFRPYRSHGFAGAHVDVMLQRALGVDVALSKPRYEAGDDVEASVTVSNHGAAHHVPSGDPLHQVRLTVGLADSTGEFLEKKETVFARKMPRVPPYRETADTRLAAGEVRTIKFSARYPGGMGEHYIVVQLRYALMPPEQAERLNIPTSVTTRLFDSQVIPIGP